MLGTWPDINYALSSRGSTCTASTEHGSFNYPCSNALDGATGTTWATAYEGVGAWIKITFPNQYLFRYTRILQRGCLCEYFDQVKLDFGNNNIVEVGLGLKKPTFYFYVRRYS